MWVLAFFDLPVVTREQRSEYRKFREKLLSDGFVMLQYSVYARPCATHEDASKHAGRVEGWLPPEGQVRVLALTSLQYSRMKCFFGKKTLEAEREPEQLSFF